MLFALRLPEAWTHRGGVAGLQPDFLTWTWQWRGIGKTVNRRTLCFCAEQKQERREAMIQIAEQNRAAASHVFILKSFHTYCA